MAPEALPKKDSVPIKSDFLDLTKYTTRNLDIEVYENTILVMFTTNNRNIIAEFYYDPVDKVHTFIRYFKFQAGITEMILLQNNFVTVGQ